MPELANLFVLLTADSAGFVAGMNTAKGAAADLEGHTGSLTRSMGEIAVAGTAVAAGMATWAVTGAAELNQSLVRIHTQAGRTGENLDYIKQALENMAPVVGQTPKALADALFFAASAFPDVNTQLAILQTAAEGAAISGSDLTETTRALVGIMQSAPPGIQNVSQAMGTINAIVGSGAMTMQEFVDSMHSGLQAELGTFKINLQSTGAAMALMADQGVPAEQSATRLRMAYALMESPTKETAKILKDLGFSNQFAADTQSAMAKALADSGVTYTQLSQDLQSPGGLLTALEDLHKHLAAAGFTQDQQGAIVSRAFGGGRMGQPIVDLYNNLGLFQQKLDQVTQGTDSFGKAWAEQTGQLSQKWNDFSKGALGDFRVFLGDLFTPMAGSVLDWLTNTGLPDFKIAVGWIKDTGIPDMGKAVNWFTTNIWPDMQKGWNWLTTDLVPKLQTWGGIAVGVFADIATAISHGLGWLFDHKAILDTIVDAVAGMFVVKKVTDWGSEAQTWVTKIMGMLYGGGGSGPGGGLLKNVATMNVDVMNVGDMNGGLGGGAGGTGGAVLGASEKSGLTLLGKIVVGAFVVSATNSVMQWMSGGGAADLFSPQSWSNFFGGVTGNFGGKDDFQKFFEQQLHFLSLPGPLGESNSDFINNMLNALGSTGVSAAAVAGDWLDFQNTADYMAHTLGLGPNDPLVKEYSDLAELVRTGKIKTAADVQTFLTNWHGVDGATSNTQQRQQDLADIIQGGRGATSLHVQQMLTSLGGAASSAGTTHVNMQQVATSIGLISPHVTDFINKWPTLIADQDTVNTELHLIGGDISDAIPWVKNYNTEWPKTLQALQSLTGDTDTVDAMLKDWAHNHPLPGGSPSGAQEPTTGNMLPHGAEGMFIRGGSNAIIRTGENEDELLIPRHKAGWLWGYMSSALANGSPGPMPAGGSIGFFGGGGGGGGVFIGNVTLPGVHNAQQFLDELRRLALHGSRSRGIGSLFGSYA